MLDVKLKIKIIKYGSKAFSDEVLLRDEVLWRPLGLHLGEGELEQEKTDCHVGAFLGKRLAGCLVLTPNGKGRMKMRQVAVRPEYQGLGIGKLMLEFSEGLALCLGFSSMIADAQKRAEGFYLKSGYASEGGEFIEVGIPHVLVVKKLGRGI
jgi:GNAT superfamily N-acetyltransferase